MRKLIYAINVSLDGCVDHTKQSPDEQLMEYFTNLLREVDVQIFGRITYQLMVPYWPDVAKDPSSTKADRGFAEAFVSARKIVVSRSLDSSEVGKQGKDTKIVRGNLRDEILKLKQEPGKNILAGGVNVPAQLIDLGLVDEFRFVVGPTIVGEGRRLFDGVSHPEKVQLKLVDSIVSKSGSVVLRYVNK